MADGTIQSLRESVNTAIEGAGPAILQRVHDHYVSEEEERRANIIVTGVNALREIENDRRKIERPDQVLYAEDGVISQSLYSKGRLDEIKKVKDRQQKLQGLLDRVVQSNAAEDYKKLEDGIKKSKGGGRPADEDE